MTTQTQTQTLSEWLDSCGDGQVDVIRSSHQVVEHLIHERWPIDVRSTLRRVAGLDPRDARPIEVVRGNVAPRAVGRGPRWTTPGGQPVRYPNAYGWPTVYHHSTRRVEVGRAWLQGWLERSPSYRHLVGRVEASR